jgi:hypothetical protein
MNLPLVSFDHVYHIGTLDPAHKGVRGPSYEGHGLSFAASEELSEEWERIAKLGGQPTWELAKPEACFVDAYALSNASRKEIKEWGVQEGYVEEITVWYAVRFDSELDSETWFAYESKEEADAEVDEDGEVRRRRGLKATPKLDALVGQKAGLACFQLLLVAYTQEATELDGVYWDDVSDGWYLAPAELSCQARSRTGGWRRFVSPSCVRD